MSKCIQEFRNSIDRYLNEGPLAVMNSGLYLGIEHQRLIDEISVDKNDLPDFNKSIDEIFTRAGVGRIDFDNIIPPWDPNFRDPYEVLTFLGQIYENLPEAVRIVWNLESAALAYPAGRLLSRYLLQRARK